MSRRKRFSGSFVALITPFRDSGRVDWDKLEELVASQVAARTDGIVCGATTGEGPTLSDGERKKVAQVCVEVAAQRIPVIVGTGSNDTRRSIRSTEEALRAGADGCLVVTPFYNKPSQKGCFLHFREVASVGLPMIVYHIPGRAAMKLTAETIFEISQIPGVVGIKEASHDIELIRKIRGMCPSLTLLSGDDDFTFEILKEGGDGVISVIGNLVPREWNQMIHLALEKKWEKASLLFQKYLPLCKALFLETNPQCVKFAMSWLGKCSPGLRLPLIEPSEENKNEMKSEILQIALPQFQKVKSRQVE